MHKLVGIGIVTEIGSFPSVLTFLLFIDPCELCKECSETRLECKNPASARPSPEGLAVDVFATVGALGFPIEVLKDYSQAMNRYSFLLLE